MKYWVILLALGVAAPLSAQSVDTHLGFGAATSNISGTVAPVLFVPIDVIPHIRFEPEIGYSRTVNEQSTQIPPPTLPPGIIIPGPIVISTSSKQVSKTMSAGTGIFFFHTRENLRLEFGARFGYTRTRTEFTTVTATTTGARGMFNTTSKLNGYFAGPALGGEYFVGDRFSLGAELHVRYASSEGRQQITNVPIVPSPPNIIPTPLPQTSTSQMSLQTRVAVIARVYVW